MKKFLAMVMIVCVSVSVLSGCGGESDAKPSDAAVTPTGTAAASSTPDAPTATPTAAAYEKGVLTENTFESAYIGVRYTASGDYVMATEAETLTLMGIGAETAGIDSKTLDYALLTTVYEMMVSTPSGIPNLSVMVEKLPMQNITVEQYLGILKEQLSSVSSMKYDLSGEIDSVSIAGQTYSRFIAHVEMSGIEMQQYYIFRKTDDRIIGFIGTCTPDTTDALDALLNSFEAY